MVRPVHHRFTFEHYLQIEEDSGIKHEFIDGGIWAMSGGSPDHARIASNVSALFAFQLAGKRCSVFSSDLRIRVLSTGLSTYPDLSVVSGQLELDPADPKGHTVTDPVVVVEVLSPTTEDYDRGEKLDQYKLIASLSAVVLVAHDQRRVDVWRRDAGRWIVDTVGGPGAVAVIAAIDCRLALDEVYRDPLT